MAEKRKKQTKKNSILLPVCVAFICGLLAGVGLAVFKITPDNRTSQHATTQEQQLDQQTATAILNLESAVTANPDNAETWTQLGHLYFDTNQPAKAVGAYTKSLELQEGNANLYTDLGIMYRRIDQPEKAVVSFSKAIELDPKHTNSRMNKGIVLLYDLNQPEEAFLTWENLLKIDPDIQLSNGDKLSNALPKIKASIAEESPESSGK